jgi:thiol-disulfide isomerase/thioredoxin
MASLDDKIYGLSLLSWLLIIIILGFFIWQMFFSAKSSSSSSSSSPSPSGKEMNEYETVSDNQSSMENFVNTNNKVKVYNFNTSWCGWSVRFQPEWNKFQDAVKSNDSLSNVDTFDIKCDKPENEEVCKEFEIQGFPTVIIEANGKRGLYKGPRESKDLIETVKDL